jgi:Tat protein secretion system quality control protein TatD with DNase activity
VVPDAPADTAVPAPADADSPALEETAQPAEAESADSLSPAAAEKLDQIKDLLITAEAIGEANLDRHFERVSQRQRELIREFFENSVPGQEPEA